MLKITSHFCHLKTDFSFVLCQFEGLGLYALFVVFQADLSLKDHIL